MFKYKLMIYNKTIRNYKFTILNSKLFYEFNNLNLTIYHCSNKIYWYEYLFCCIKKIIYHSIINKNKPQKLRWQSPIQSYIVSQNQLNYEQICKDVINRNKIMLDYKLIIERRIRIESEYLSKMKQLYTLPEMRKIPNPTKTSQIMYNSLINAINAEVDNITNHVSRMETQIIKQLACKCFQLENETKREVLNASLIVKDYEKRYQDIEKLRYKVMKKTSQLKKLKEEYIVGILVDMPFDKKNKLFIRTKQIQQVYKPLKQQFEHSAKQFNEKAAFAAQKLKEVIKRLQVRQLEKVDLMKQIFMVLQISNSEYGANLIQDKASILSRLNKIQMTNPDIKLCDTIMFDNCKNQMLIHQYDPSSYINNLFTNIVDTKNMQGLVIYGHQARHRQSISFCMQSAQIESIQEKPEFVFVKQIAFCFKNIFNQDIELDPHKIKKIEQLMDNSPQGRKNFILCLQKFRTISKFDISENKLEPVRKILNIFLDQCMRQMDTYNSKLLLVLSFTYYVIQNGERIDLHYFIQDHNIWKEKQWWQSALLESSYEQMKIKPKKMQEPPITIWHIKGAGFKNSQNQHQMTSQNILFNQLTFYLHNMKLFGIKDELIAYIARKYVKYFQFNAKIVADIEPFLKAEESVLQQMQNQILLPHESPISCKKKTRRIFSRS